MGHLIPAGTGFKAYRDIELSQPVDSFESTTNEESQKAAS
jgi:hypothetical protein